MTLAEVALAVIGYVVVFLLPGFLWTRVLLRDRRIELPANLAISFVVGLILVNGSIFFASFLFQVSINQLSVAAIFTVLLIAPVGILFRLKDSGLLKIFQRLLGPFGRRLRPGK